MLLTAALWSIGLAAGISLQRRASNPQRLSYVLFLATFWVTSPLVVFFAYTTLTLDARLLAAMALVVASSCSCSPRRGAAQLPGATRPSAAP